MKSRYDEIVEVLQNKSKIDCIGITKMLIIIGLIFSIIGGICTRNLELAILMIAIFIILIPFLLLINILNKRATNKKIKKIEAYQDEINEFCDFDTYFNAQEWCLYTKHHIIRSSSYGKFEVISLSEISSARDYNINSRNSENTPFTTITLTNGKKKKFDTTDNLHKVLLEYYQEEDKERITKELKELEEQEPKIFNHSKYGNFEYYMCELTEEDESTEIFLYYMNETLKNKELIIDFFNIKEANDFLKNDEIKNKVLDKCYDYFQKYSTKAKKMFVESKIDILIKWIGNEDESSPFCTKNKDDFKKAVLNYEKYYLYHVKLDSNYNIISATFTINVDNVHFDIYYNPETGKMSYDIIS